MWELSTGFGTSLRTGAAGYVLAAAAIALAALFRYWLRGFFGYNLAYITFYPAVMLVATLGGFRRVTVHGLARRRGSLLGRERTEPETGKQRVARI